MHERHNIYLKKELEWDWPWTDDNILQTYKFTNVFRELDTGTVWCRENIRDPYADHPELFFNIATYRRYNRIETAEDIGFIGDYRVGASKIIAKMMARRDANLPIFTSAHMVCGTIRDKDGNIPDNKVTQIFDISFRDLWERRKEVEPQPGDTLRVAYNRLLDAGIPGFGDFICYEVVSDLRHTRYLNTADDILTWANPGPGAKRGIVRLYGHSPTNPKRVRFNYDGYVEVMYWLQEKFNRFKEDWMPLVEMRDIEHSLCEFDKYERVRLGEGRPRMKYKPPQV
jgi:hypothetical protein